MRIRCSMTKSTHQFLKFEFGEFFAGMGGFSETVEELGCDAITISSPLDGYDGWDILTDDGQREGQRLCSEIDHGHFAPPCRTLTMARREDEFGSVKQLRSASSPEGLGDPQSEEANNIVQRMVALILLLVSRGRTFAVENPWDSFLWALRCMVAILKIPGVELIYLHQCPYGSVTQKPTGILTNAAWMKVVCKLCHEVREHYHLKGDLVGKAWSYHEEKYVWRTSLAAEYPCGLTVAWTQSLLHWLGSNDGRAWMLEHSFTKTGRWNNVLVKPSLVKTSGQGDDEPQSVPAEKGTLQETRERENREAHGGLRYAKREVSKSRPLRSVGARVRKTIDTWMVEETLERLNWDLTAGIEEAEVVRLRKMLCDEFNVADETGRWPVSLWSTMLHEALDPEMNVLPNWMSLGFPLGIKTCIEHTGVLPRTYHHTASVESSRLEGVILHDDLGPRRTQQLHKLC